VARVGGLLLTGGASRRLGVPKASLERDGERLADRGARVLRAVCTPVLEVGPSWTSLPAVLEQPPGAGPLAAVAAGGARIRREGHVGAVVVLAVDLPFVDERLVTWLADGVGTLVPVVDGQPQPLCARYAPEALGEATRLVAAGERSMRALLAATRAVAYADESVWGAVAEARTFADIDTATDASDAGLVLPTAPSHPSYPTEPGDGAGGAPR
jgi:molybdopterin-guanine dinucleotide biosynthesis protein A